MSGLKILLYANVDSAHAGGVQSVVRSLRDHLAARGHAVSTGWAERSGAAAGAGADGWSGQFPVRSGSPRWLHLPTAARLLARLLRERPQVVNIHYASPSTLYFTALARWLGFRVVVTCHGSDILRPLAADAPFLARIICRADAVTAVSPDIAARLPAKGPRPCRPAEVIANGVDTVFWHPAPQTCNGGSDPVLVSVGRLEPVKGFDLLIAACAMLEQRGCPVRLVLIGEGSQADALADQARQLGIAGRVTFAGRCAPTDIRAHFHAADLFVLPSRSEGMPLALLEAMASGLPAVAAKVGGVARTAAGSARLVPPENAADLAAAIADLVQDRDARKALGQQARKRARDFSVAQAHAAYEAVMCELARPKRE